MGTQRVKKKGVLPRSFLVCFTGLVVPVQEVFELAVLAGSLQNIFFLTVHYFDSFVPQLILSRVLYILYFCDSGAENETFSNVHENVVIKNLKKLKMASIYKEERCW
jgi:hypothetical protein